MDNYPDDPEAMPHNHLNVLLIAVELKAYGVGFTQAAHEVSLVMKSMAIGMTSAAAPAQPREDVAEPFSEVRQALDAFQNALRDNRVHCPLADLRGQAMPDESIEILQEVRPKLELLLDQHDQSKIAQGLALIVGSLQGQLTMAIRAASKAVARLDG